MDIENQISIFVKELNNEYYNTHLNRYIELGKHIPFGKDCMFAIELGATPIFQILLHNYFRYQRVMGTDWSNNIEEKIYTKKYTILHQESLSEIISIDLERELFPLEKECVDFVLCSEVIEHLDIDPMFMLTEINRIMKKNGKILITSPNSCSARNFNKIAHGYRPHFFMQYIKDRSPNRHNIEYDVHSLRILLESAGFQIIEYFTQDVFEPQSWEGINLLKKMNLPLSDRGDCIFMIASKISDVLDRWPGGIYA